MLICKYNNKKPHRKIYVAIVINNFALLVNSRSAFPAFESMGIGPSAR